MRSPLKKRVMQTIPEAKETEASPRKAVILNIPEALPLPLGGGVKPQECSG
jgi:hypothetical protein